MAFSRSDTFKGKKLIESCCTAFQLKVFQKKEFQAERFWRRVSPSMDKDAGRGSWLRLKNTFKQLVQLFPESNRTDSIHASEEE